MSWAAGTDNEASQEEGMQVQIFLRTYSLFLMCVVYWCSSTDCLNRYDEKSTKIRMKEILVKY